MARKTQTPAAPKREYTADEKSYFDHRTAELQTARYKEDLLEGVRRTIKSLQETAKTLERELTYLDHPEYPRDITDVVGTTIHTVLWMVPNMPLISLERDVARYVEAKTELKFLPEGTKPDGINF